MGARIALVLRSRVMYDGALTSFVRSPVRTLRIQMRKCLMQLRTSVFGFSISNRIGFTDTECDADMDSIDATSVCAPHTCSLPPYDD